MPITVTCTCGAPYTLRDEFAGKTMRCPGCKTILQIPFPSLPMVAPIKQVDALFDRDKFLLRQKVIAINEKYFVSDETNEPLIFVERPAFLLQNLLALAAALIAGLIVLVAPIALALTYYRNSEVVLGLSVVVGLPLAAVVALVVGIPLSPKRHVSFYRDETKSQLLFEILQDKKFQPITATYTMRDSTGQVLARFRKNVLYNFFRKRWVCLSPADESLVCIALEDSLILSLLRRFLGSFYGLLRTNFVFMTPDQLHIIGEFNRKFTLFDRYVLDLSHDPTRTLERRVALAMGVLLDTGERR